MGRGRVELGAAGVMLPGMGELSWPGGLGKRSISQATRLRISMRAALHIAHVRAELRTWMLAAWHRAYIRTELRNRGLQGQGN